MNIRTFIFPFSLIILSSVILLSCRSATDGDMESCVGKTITISGELVKGPSGYMVYRGVDLDSIYLTPSPESLSNQRTAKAYRDFTSMNDGRKITVTGTLVFRRIDDKTKFPEETEKPPTEIYLIYWDAKDTQVNAK